MKTNYTALFVLSLCFLLAEYSFAQDKSSNRDIQVMKENMASTKMGGLFLSRAAGVVTSENYGLTLSEQSNWDGEDWAPNSRIEIIYDQFGRSQILHLQAVQGDFVPMDRITFTREGNTLIRTEESYDIGTQNYIPEFRETYTYDVHNAIHSELLYEVWDGDAWQIDERETITFANGLISQVLMEDYFDGEWENNYLYTFTEEADGVIETGQSWIGDEWVNEERYIQHDLSLADYMNVMVELFEQMDYEFINFFVYFESFPSFTTQIWDEDEWVNEDRLTSDIVVENGVTQRIMSFEFWEEDEWVGESRFVFTYEGDLAVNLVVEEDMGEGDWEAFFTEDYTYDDNNLLITAIQQFSMGEGFENSSRIDNTWELVPTSSETDDLLPLTHKLLNAYPNPFNPSTVIPYEMAATEHVAIRVYDVTGRLVSTLFEGVQSAGTHQVTFDASGVASGKYIIRMESQGFTTAIGVTLIK